MQPDFIAFPGTRFSSEHHYAVFMKGSTHLTSHLLTPVLIDASTLQVTAVAERPWYMDAMGMSQPLHFGDYGGMPMKILWATLDVLTIIVLGSGVPVAGTAQNRETAAGKSGERGMSPASRTSGRSSPPRRHRPVQCRRVVCRAPGRWHLGCLELAGLGDSRVSGLRIDATQLT
jgi:uncharacterized iron-regulated membrane protein